MLFILPLRKQENYTENILRYPFKEQWIINIKYHIAYYNWF